MSVRTGKEILAEGVEAAREAAYWQRADGRWVTPDGQVLKKGIDPVPVKRAAIKAGFQQAVLEAKQLHSDVQPQRLDVWELINEEVVLREGKPLYRDFERLVDRWDDFMDRPVIRERMEKLAEQHRQWAEE